LADLQELVRYWGSEYNWRKAERKLNAYPQYITKIDGLDIHFIHVKSRHPRALPLIITNGWPGSVCEQIKLIGPLTDPTRDGGRAEDAFDVVIPSLPGLGHSARPTEAGSPARRSILARPCARNSDRCESRRGRSCIPGISHSPSRSLALPMQ
jgi:pimeloyl-ACP methyl ester carboxylesterase